MGRIRGLDDHILTELNNKILDIVFDNITDEHKEYSKYSPANMYSPAEGGYWISVRTKFSKKLIEDIVGLKDLNNNDVNELVGEALSCMSDELNEELNNSAPAGIYFRLINWEISNERDMVVVDISNEEYEEYDYDDY